MKKDFDGWNEYKKKVEKRSQVHIKTREIWWCILGINIGSEQHSSSENFTRPVLVFKKWHSGLFWGIPLTTKLKDVKERYTFELHGIQNDALLVQMSVFDSRRVTRKIGKMSIEQFNELTKIVGELIASS